TFLLFFSASRDDSRADQIKAERVDQLRRFGTRPLFLPDSLLNDRRAAPAILLRPRDARPASFANFLLPIAQEVKIRALLFGCRAARPRWRHVGLQPGAQFIAKLLLAR